MKCIAYSYTYTFNHRIVTSNLPGSFLYLSHPLIFLFIFFAMQKLCRALRHTNQDYIYTHTHTHQCKCARILLSFRPSKCCLNVTVIHSVGEWCVRQTTPNYRTENTKTLSKSVNNMWCREYAIEGIICQVDAEWTPMSVCTLCC